MRLTITLLTLFVATQLLAQADCKGTITGQVLDKDTNEPLPFATVKLLNSKKGAISDEQGTFTITNICEREVDFEVRFLGYKTVVHHHDFRNGDHVNNGHLVYLAQEENLLESVVVEGEEIVGDLQSLSVEKIDRAQLESNITGSLATAIENVQGVTFASTGSNVQLPVIHGLYGNRILIINKGVKHGFQNWGTDHAPEIDITSADRITVLKGAAGVRYGPEALGGVVVVDGNPLSLSQKMYGSITSGYQTNGRGYHTNANFGAGYRTFSYHVGGNYLRLGDRKAPDYSLTNTGREERSAYAGFRYHLPNWDFELNYSYIDQNLGLLRSSVAESGGLLARAIAASEPLIVNDFSYTIGEPNQATTHHLTTLGVDWHTNMGKIALLLSYQINLREEFDVRRNADRPIIDLQLNTTDVRLEWFHPVVSGLEGTVGLQYFSQNNDNKPGTLTTPFIPNYNTHRYSLYAIESLEKGKNTFELGIRLDHEYNSARGRETNQDIFRNEFSFTNFTASLGLVRAISPHWQFRTNVGSAWRPPNMAELYSFGQHSFKGIFGLWRHYFDENNEAQTDRVLTEEDDAADPERGYKWINEIAYQKNGSALTITAYGHFIENFIFDRPVTVTRTIRNEIMPIFFYEQADALFFGADLSYSKRFSERVKGTFGTSFLFPKNIEENEALINQPPITINAEVAWQTPTFFGLDYSKLFFQTSYTFRQFQAPRTITINQIITGEVDITEDTEIFDFRDAPEGYFLGHVRWEWKRKQLGGQLEVRNVLNTSYRDYLNQMRYFADELGRNFLITLHYKF